jgi:hypothetical protein
VNVSAQVRRPNAPSAPAAGKVAAIGRASCGAAAAVGAAMVAVDEAGAGGVKPSAAAVGVADGDAGRAQGGGAD